MTTARSRLLYATHTALSYHGTPDRQATPYHVEAARTLLAPQRRTRVLNDPNTAEMLETGAKLTGPSLQAYVGFKRALDNTIELALRSTPSFPSRSGPVLSRSQLRDLNALLAHDSLTVVLADKNMGFTIVHDGWVRNGVAAQIGDPARYEKLDPATGSAQLQEATGKFTKLLDKLRLYDTGDKRNVTVGKALKPALKVNLPTPGSAALPCTIKPLAKVHKAANGPLLPSHMRIITQAQNSPFQPFCFWMAKLLQPVVLKTVPSYLRDSTHLVSLLDTLRVDPNATYTIITADATNLYGNITKKLLDHALATALFELHSLGVFNRDAINQLFDIIELINTNCFVTFEGSWFKQRLGIAMGIADGVQKANLALGFVEKAFFRHFVDLQARFPLFKRYIDDIFAIFRGTAAEARSAFKKFEVCSELQWNAEFYEFGPGSSSPSLPANNRATFLDLHVWRDGAKFLTALHVKATNLRLYIPPSSLHPGHTSTGWITGEIKRIARSCSSQIDFDRELWSFYWALRGRGHAANYLLPLFVVDHDKTRGAILKQAQQKLNTETWQHLLKDFNPTYGDRFFFVVPYHPATTTVNWSAALNAGAAKPFAALNAQLHRTGAAPFKARFSTAWSTLPSLSRSLDSAFKRHSRTKFSAPTPTLTYPNPNPNGNGKGNGERGGAQEQLLRQLPEDDDRLLDLANAPSPQSLDGLLEYQHSPSPIVASTHSAPVSTADYGTGHPGSIPPSPLPPSVQPEISEIPEAPFRNSSSVRNYSSVRKSF